MRLPLITAHAGCMNTKPNSVESVLEGIKAGADIIEIDVRSTGDGTVILMHDPTISSSAYGVLPVDKLTYAELKTINETRDIVKLEEVLDLVSGYGKVLNLDVKDHNVINLLVRTVKARKMVDNVVLSGCSKDKALYISENYPGFRVLLNADEYFLNLSKSDYRSAVEASCHDAISMSCCGINLDYRHCCKQLIEYTHSRFLPVAVWTIDDVDEIKQYIKSGVYSITTNNVKAMAKLKVGITEF